MSHHRSVMKAATVCCLVLISFCATLCASPDKKGDKPVGKLLFGKALDGDDNPLPDAVVYVTNTRTRAVKTYIVGKDGAFRFPALDSAVDYEFYAQFNAQKSDTKSVSPLAARPQGSLVLKTN